MSDKKHGDESSRSTICLDHKAITLGSDVDLTAFWPDQKFVRGLRNGSAAAADIAAVTLGGNSVVFKNVPSGGWEFGQFITVVNATTTATNMLAGK